MVSRWFDKHCMRSLNSLASVITYTGEGKLMAGQQIPVIKCNIFLQTRVSYIYTSAQDKYFNLLDNASNLVIKLSRCEQEVTYN